MSDRRCDCNEAWRETALKEMGSDERSDGQDERQKV